MSTGLDPLRGAYDESVSTAAHEAGHAAAHLLLGSRFKFVTVVPDDQAGNLGSLHGIRPRWAGKPAEYASPPLEWVVNEAVALLAGHAAEWAYGVRKSSRPADWRVLMQQGAWQDQQMVVALCSSTVGDETELRHLLGWLDSRTATLMRHPLWKPGHRRVTRSLLEHGTLTYRAAQAAFFARGTADL